MLDKVTSGVHRADEDDIWGNEVTYRPEKSFDFGDAEIDGKPIGITTIPEVTYVHEGIISPDIPNYLVRDASLRLSPTLAIVVESDRLAALARIEELAAENARLRSTLAVTINPTIAKIEGR